MAGAAYLAEAGAIVVGADNVALEVLPTGTPDHWSPVHTYLLAECGVPILELAQLEELQPPRPRVRVRLRRRLHAHPRRHRRPDPSAGPAVRGLMKSCTAGGCSKATARCWSRATPRSWSSTCRTTSVFPRALRPLRLRRRPGDGHRPGRGRARVGRARGRPARGLGPAVDPPGRPQRLARLAELQEPARRGLRHRLHPRGWLGPVVARAADLRPWRAGGEEAPLERLHPHVHGHPAAGQRGPDDRRLRLHDRGLRRVDRPRLRVSRLLRGRGRGRGRLQHPGPPRRRDDGDAIQSRVRSCRSLAQTWQPAEVGS